MPLALKRPSLSRLLVVTGLSVVAFLLVWPFVGTRLIGRRTAASAYRQAANAQVVAGKFAYSPLADAAEFDRAADRLIAAEASRRSETSDPVDWPGAVRLSLAFLKVCAAGDASAYERWAYETQGKVMPPEFPTWGPYSRDTYATRFQIIVGDAMPGAIRPDEYFRRYFEAFWTRGGSEMRPSAVAIDPQAIEVKTVRFSHWGDAVGPATRRDGLGPMFWFGGIGGAAIPFLWPERVLLRSGEAIEQSRIFSGGTTHDRVRLLFGNLIERSGQLHAARIHLVYRGETGICIPVNFLLIQRPDDGQWEMIDFVINNIGADVGVGTNPGVPIF
ncbi:MAG: hypothetical protein JNK58_12310 [Phycisphaerae bacterium]|nr:hypothetical protein [Phycisphaerae bacterium]